jgi:hypothetical protein
MINDVVLKKGKCSILDIGGTFDFWRTWETEIAWDVVSITCVNRDPSHYSHGSDGAPIRMVEADACNLTDIEDEEFDIAFSNSVIEHVGAWSRMEAMAREVQRVAPRFLIQTPNFWFPIEPHARTPFLHWLPEPWAYRVVMTRKCGFWQRQTTVSGAVRQVQSAKLLDFRQMQELFPQAKILRERFLGITKSFIALKE